MDVPDDLNPPAPAKPRLLAVAGLFVAAAGLISYLVAYACTDALVKAEFLSHWQPGHDPRPKRFFIGFGVVLSLFTSAAGLMRVLGRNGAKENDIDESDDLAA